jgi:hypothetical protein
MPPTPESLARENIDAQLTACGWVVQEVESVVAASLARAERLRQSVLKSAFEGRLG